MAQPLPDGSVGVAYGPTQVEAVGGTPPYQFSVCGLPADLSCDSDGVIQGVPALSSYGFWQVTVTADDNAGFTAYGVKDIVIHGAVGLSNFYHGYTAKTGTVDVALPDNDPGELRMIMAFVRRTTPAVQTPPTIAGWTFRDSGVNNNEFQAWRWDRVKVDGDPNTVTVNFGPSWTGLILGSAFYFGDESTSFVYAASAASASTTLAMTGVTPTAVSDAVMVAVGYGPGGLSNEGWLDDLGDGVDEFIGWPLTFAEYMQWPATPIPGPTLTAVPSMPRIAGWVFAMARVS